MNQIKTAVPIRVVADTPQVNVSQTPIQVRIANNKYRGYFKRYYAPWLCWIFFWVILVCYVLGWFVLSVAISQIDEETIPAALKLFSILMCGIVCIGHVVLWRIFFEFVVVTFEIERHLRKQVKQ